MAHIREITIEDLSTEDNIIAILGPTGTGKSTFIEIATGITGLAGHGLESCTQHIRIFRCPFQELDGASVCLVDTPGFDDTHKSDYDIFKPISDWHLKIYKRRLQLKGLLYFHRISDHRVGGTSSKNLGFFKELFGTELDKVVLTTTMWDLVDEKTGIEREKQLRLIYWQSMITQGSSIKRFMGDRESALEILRPIVARLEKLPFKVPKPKAKWSIPTGSGKSSSTIDPYKVGLDDQVIVVMGPTGCGKSNFIDHLTKSTTWSGTSLKSVTQGVRAIRVPLFNANVVLVDTPGFDNTCRSDITILEVIGDWLKKTYENDIKLTGILYLHRITDVRMSGTTFRNLRMFGKLCGSNPASKVIFVTTMWDKTSIRQGEHKEKKEQKEKELKEKYWRPMLELGARTDRFLQNKENCAQDIIKRLLEPRASEATPLLFQKETVDQHRAIVETEAAKALYSQMNTLLFQHKAALAELQESARKTDNPQMLADLQKEEARIQSELDKTFADSRELKLSLLQRMQLLFAGRASTNGHSINFLLGSNGS